QPPPNSTLFPYTTLFRSKTFISLMILEFGVVVWGVKYTMSPFYERWLNNDFYAGILIGLTITIILMLGIYFIALRPNNLTWRARSEEHTSELQSRFDLVC